MSSWVICAGRDQSQVIKEYLIKSGTTQSITFESNPFKLRQTLKYMPLRLGVIVGEGIEGPQAVNVAAAIVQDACATETVLVVRDASGSLRSRAKRAGITRVVSIEELKSAPAAAKPLNQLASHLSKTVKSTGDELEPRNGSCDASEEACACERERESAVPSELVLSDTEATTELSSTQKAPLERREGVPVITFVSGRGGTGKSTICALAGYIAASWGMRVALLDLDLAFGNLAALCGVEHTTDLAGYIEGGPSGGVSISQGTEVVERLEVFGPCRAPEYAELVQPYAAQLIAALTQTHDIVLVDTTTSWGDAIASAAQEADRLAIVTDERPGAIASLARCGGLAVRLGVARTRIVRVMNGCDPKRRDAEFVARAATGLECAREVRVLDGDIEAIELLACGRAQELLKVANPLATSVATGLAQILQELGKLPPDEKAQAALRGGPRKTRRLFAPKQELASV